MKTDCATRTQVLQAALKQFAERGYAGASVQRIVDAAAVTKPTLYYYFRNKAELYQALVDDAQDERLRLMKAAAARPADLPEKLVKILAALFEFATAHRELMRIAFSTAFAAAGEIPPGSRSLEKSRRNFEFIHALIKDGLAKGRLNRCFTSQELTMSIYGLQMINVATHLVKPDHLLNRETAERIVKLFLEGAAAKRGGSRTREDDTV